MNLATTEDRKYIEHHRKIWQTRPELRSVYQEWFGELLKWARERPPVVEIGSGPGFFKEFYASTISTDIIPNPWIDTVCSASALPFSSESIGSLVLLDVVHHLPKPLKFMNEAARVLKPGGRLVMLEPWITPFSYILYRYFHHEDCSLNVDLDAPFNSDKTAFAGNAGVPYRLFQHISNHSNSLKQVFVKRFIALPYLATLGFQRSRAMPAGVIRVARILERLSIPARFIAATRFLVVWQKTAG